MTRTREQVWFLAILGFTVAVVQLLSVRSELWPQLRLIDWVVLSLLLVGPLVALWQHFREIRDTTEAAWKTGVRLALGGYIPLCFGLGLIRRVLTS